MFLKLELHLLKLNFRTMFTKEFKETLKDWYNYEVESESPLTLSSTEDEYNTKLIGLPAEILIKGLKRDLEQEERDGGDYSQLDSLDDNDIVLVTADVNYADEFNMSEFITMTVRDFKDMVTKLQGYEDEIEWYFGTNEEFRFGDGEDLLSNINFRLITQEESDVLDSLFDGVFGQARVFDNIFELFGDEGEYENEDYEFFSKLDLINIEKLKEKGWSIEIYKKEEDLIKYTHENGVDSAITNACLIDDLIEYYKKNKV